MTDRLTVRPGDPPPSGLPLQCLLCMMPQQQLYYLCTHSKSLKLNVSIVTAFTLTLPLRAGRQHAEAKIGTDSDEATTMMPPTFPVGGGWVI